jgi:hypothetical protein
MPSAASPEARPPPSRKRLLLWNRGKLFDQKPSLRQKEVWSIRIRLQLQERLRELALFNLAIDGKLCVEARRGAGPRGHGGDGRARHASVLRLRATARVLDGDARRGADGGARALAGGPVAPAWGLSELRIPPDPVMDQRSCPIARWVAGPARPAARSPSALARRRRDRAVSSLRPGSFFVLYGGD